MAQLSSPKPYKDYPQLVSILESRGMIIPDKARAERKLSQIGYYRLSGFWYTCRRMNLLSLALPVSRRLDCFEDGVNFNKIIDLYIFDKKLRQLMMDAIERIEVHVRSIIAHEVGYHDPLAYSDSSYINPRQASGWVDRNGNHRNSWSEWLIKHNKQIDRSREDCLEWHRRNNKAMPFWVVVEAWDFGLMSKYYEMLKQSHQNRIAYRLSISNPRILKEWLKEINTLRNRCAHHTRIWNQKNNSALPLINDPYFINLNLDQNSRERLYGLISIIWFLLKQIGPSSDWIRTVADVIDSKPSIIGCPYKSMGFPDENGFPRATFGI